MQFYNQGDDCYTDYNGLFSGSCGNFPGSSVVEISKYPFFLDEDFFFLTWESMEFQWAQL